MSPELRWCEIGFSCAVAVGCSVELAPLDSSGDAGVGGAAVTSDAPDDQAGGGGSTGTGGATDAAGACWSFCQKASAASCNAETVDACNDSCEAGYSYYSRCASEYAASVECGASVGTFQCFNGFPEITNCMTEGQLFSDCIWHVTPSCSLPAVVPSGGGCYLTSPCNPVTNGCPAGRTCDWVYQGYYDLTCWPPGAFTGALCQPCDDQNGPFCQPGMSCIGENGTVCARYCCSDADCGGAAGSCTPWGDSNLRFCGT